MLSLSTLYTGQKEFEGFIAKSPLDQKKESLVRIYTAGCTPDEAVRLARQVRAVIPKGKILGSSACGVILKGAQYEGETLVLVEQFAQAQVKTAMYRVLNHEPEALAAMLCADYNRPDTALVHVLMGNYYDKAFRFVEEVNRLAPALRLTGAVAGEIQAGGLTPYVFDERGAAEKAMMTASLQGALWISSETSLTSEPISPVYQVTKSQGNWILEIDHRPALLWCKEQLGMEKLDEYSGWGVIAEEDPLIRFPLILEGHGGAGRFIHYENGKIGQYFSMMEEDISFRIGYTSPAKCVQESLKNCRNFSLVPVESLFCYTCLFRKLYLQNCAEWELRPFADHDICGAFMMGEIGWLNRRNEFMNGACALVGVAENEVYIAPDFSVFEDLEKIRDDNNRLNSLMLQRQSAAMSRENQALLRELLLQQQRAKEQMYTDPLTGLENAIKFAQDNLSCVFDKLGLIQTENATLLLTHFGKEHYHKLMRQVVTRVNEYMNGEPLAAGIRFYTLDEATFFVAAGAQVSEADFTALCRKLYDEFQFIDLGEQGLLVNRFVVVMGQKNVLERALAISKGQRSPQNYLVSKGFGKESEEKIARETAMLQLLGQVLENGWVVPYFQGIHDNQTGRIQKYEALMRIRDASGKVYLPSDFMEVAKKYHLYASLSHMMIEKVFDLFAGREEEVSINISYQDITVEELREFILERLDAIGRADNFVFEILEDEELRDLEQLREFILQIKPYGAKMAVDDFGSGYSNFLEIVRLEPDFIKVDGSIIKGVCKDESSRKVLSAIVGLAAQMGAQIVAEFVESREVQDYMEAAGIPYSQGFYYSVPRPFEEALELNREEHEMR